jgi:hypothetical protein
MCVGVDVWVSVAVEVGVGVGVSVLVLVGVEVGVGVAQTFAAQTSLAAQHTPPQRPTLVPPGPQMEKGPLPCAA